MEDMAWFDDDDEFLASTVYIGGPVPLPDLYQRIKLTGPSAGGVTLQDSLAVVPNKALTSGYVLVLDPNELENGVDVDVELTEETRVSVKAGEADVLLGPVVVMREDLMVSNLLCNCQFDT